MPPPPPDPPLGLGTSSVVAEPCPPPFAVIESNTELAPPAPPDPLPFDLQAYLDEQERAILMRALEDNQFNRTATAARLGLSLRQIRYRIERLNIPIPQDSESHEAG